MSQLWRTTDNGRTECEDRAILKQNSQLIIWGQFWGWPITMVSLDKQNECNFFQFFLDSLWDIMAKACTLLWEDQNSKWFKVSDFFLLGKKRNIRWDLVHLHDINGEWLGHGKYFLWVDQNSKQFKIPEKKYSIRSCAFAWYQWCWDMAKACTFLWVDQNSKQSKIQEKKYSILCICMISMGSGNRKIWWGCLELALRWHIHWMPPVPNPNLNTQR